MQSARKQDANLSGYLSQLWFKYFPYWPLFLIFSGLCLAGAWYYLQHQIPMYSATASILIKDQSRGYNESQVLEDLSPITPKNIIENEIEIIKSRSLMTEVVKNLGLYAPVYEDGKFSPRSAYETSPISIEVQKPDSLIPTNKVYFDYDNKNNQVVIEKNAYPVNKWVSTKYGSLRFVPNKNYAGSNKDPLYFYLFYPQDIAPAFAGSLSITSINKASTVLYLNIIDEVPERAKQVLNELIRVYNDASINDKNKLAATTLSFVEDRLKYVSQDLDSIERELQVYKMQKGVVDLSQQGQMFLSNVSLNDQKLAEVNMQLDLLNQVRSYVLSKDRETGIVPSSLGIKDEVLSQLLDKLYESELQYERMKKTTAENNPILTSIASQIDKLKPSILENIQNQKASLMATRSNVAKTSNLYTSMLQKLPKQERELIGINREQAIKNSIYTFLLQKREETALSYASTIPDSRIVDSAVASWIPNSPSASRIYTIAILIAIFLCVALITANEIFNSTILYRHEIESLTAFPIIGEIAFNKNNKFLMTEADKTSFLPENFRKLRTSLTFLGIGAKRKRILVTSTIPGEGKSFIAINLGLSLAMAGKKVVLLEFDLAQPTLCKKLNIFEENGLTDYLIGDMEAEEIIKKTGTHENLFIIPSGPLPDNPSEMILNEKVQDLLAYLDTIFDSIIIDTAPVGPMTDAYVLSSQCDATLYVVRHKYTPKVLVQRIDEENKINNLKNAAIVFNAVKPRGFSKNDYGYGYGHGYKYLGYGSEDTGRKRLAHKRKIDS